MRVTLGTKFGLGFGVTLALMIFSVPWPIKVREYQEKSRRHV